MAEDVNQNQRIADIFDKIFGKMAPSVGLVCSNVVEENLNRALGYLPPTIFTILIRERAHVSRQILWWEKSKKSPKVRVICKADHPSYDRAKTNMIGQSLFALNRAEFSLNLLP